MQPLWYIFSIILLLVTFINLFGASNDGSWSPIIHAFSGISTWITIILGFIFTGWIGGFVLFIIFVFIIGPISQRLSFMVYKLTRPNAKFLTYKLFKLRDELREQARKSSSNIEHVTNIIHEIDDYITGMKTSENVIQFFKYNGIDINKINEIRSILLASGVGEFVTYCVIKSPDLVLKYVEMEKQGLTPRDISYEFLKGLEGSL